MTRDEVLGVCSGMPGAFEDYPFGDDAAVFKVGGKMFALVALAGKPGSVSLKCDPDWALELRATYASVGPGYHLNTRHWNTVELDGSVEPDELRAMIDHSYELVVRSLPRHRRPPPPGAMIPLRARPGVSPRARHSVRPRARGEPPLGRRGPYVAGRRGRSWERFTDAFDLAPPWSGRRAATRRAGRRARRQRR